MPFKQSIPFLTLVAVPALARLGAAGLWLLLLSVLLIFVALDSALGEQAADVAAAGEALLARFLPWLYIVLQLALILWGAVAASRAASLADIIALAMAIGAAAGTFGMLAAHEAIHARHPAERALGLAMLAAIGYMHFGISHVQGHHRFAATWADPATARRGESAYRFIARSIAGQWRLAWACERARVARRRAPFFAHRLCGYLAIQTAMVPALLLALGVKALLYQLAMSVVAVLFLELFNYVAHYGLLRRVLADGSLEKLGPQHSWNVRRRFNNWALFNGGHHSDHHRSPARRYQRLVAVPEAPLLPAGYAGSLMLALVPPLWRRVMERRLDALNRPASAAAPSPSRPVFPAAGPAA
jgi:alkane 1-monooxygenase